MTRSRGIAVIALMLGTIAASVASAQQSPAPAGGQKPAQPPSTAPAAPAQPTAPAAPATPATATQARVFSAPAGLLFNTVRPERVADFEKVMAYLHAAFEKSTDEKVRAQAKGWHIFKATETAQGNAVLYIYYLDPTVMGADYGIGKIIADTYPEQAAEIWKLYTGAVTGGTLLNLTPVMPVEPPPLGPAETKKP